jgi:oligosaccharyl transferase (archaeosortase A-associated)
MNISRISPKLIIAILMTVIFGISLLFRIVLPYHEVFNGIWIKYTSIDAYFHMRLVDNIAFNFPHLMNFDPYFVYPGGYVLNNIYFPNWLLAGIIWILTLGSPTQHAIDAISPLFPAVVAALTVIPVFFIGKTLFNRWVGVLAAGLMAVLPGEYLGRTIIGLNDTPGIEVLLSTTFLAFIIMAVKSAREKGLTFDHILKRDWPKCLRPIVFSALAGLFLGMYLVSWAGAMLFIFIFDLYLVIRCIKDHFRQQSVDYLAIIGVIALLIGLIIYFPVALSSLYMIAVFLALLIPVLLVIISRVIAARKIRPLFFPVSLVVIGGIAVAIFFAISPERFSSMFSLFKIFAPSGATAATTIEMQPFLAPSGIFSTQIAWGNFSTSFFLLKNLAFPGLALISLSILIYLFIKKPGSPASILRPVIWTVLILLVIMLMMLMSGYGHRFWALAFAAVLLALLFVPDDSEKNWLLFLAWSIIIMALTLGQRRFAYYLVVNIAVLSAYLSWQILWLSGVRKLASPSGEAPVAESEARAKARKKGKRRERRGVSLYIVTTAVASLVVFFLVFFPNITKAASMTTPEEAPYAPSDAWIASLTWMKDNTPEPMGNPDDYYRLYEAPPPGETFQYPASAYGVTSWWDYGYWITRIAHRIPSANPSQQPERILRVADLFLSQEEEPTRALLEEMGTSYVVIDYPTVTSKYWAVVTWSGQPETQYYDVFYVQIQDKYQGVTFYKPAYYQTLAVRLYNFNAEAVTKVNPAVITYVEKQQQGITYKLVSDIKQFTSYKEAQDYFDSLETDKKIIIGVNPFLSPIPMEAVPDFHLVHSSEEGTSLKNVGFIPEVKIFEYTGRNK